MTASDLYPLLDSPIGRRHAHTDAMMLLRATVTCYGDSSLPRAVAAMRCECRIPADFSGVWPLHDGSRLLVTASAVEPVFA